VGEGDGVAVGPGTRRETFLRRVEIVRALLAEREAAAAFLATRPNVAWLTLGADAHVVRASDAACVGLLVTHDAIRAITTVVEARRIADEELADLDLDLEAIPWHEEIAAAARRYGGADMLTDADVEADLRRERARLDEVEEQRLRWLGATADAAVARTCAEIERGEPEQAVAARLGALLLRRGVASPLVLVGADDRIARYRHPIPTAQQIDRLVVIALVAERWGLHAALTRMVGLGDPSDGTQKRYASARRVEDAFQAATRPERRLSEILGDGIEAYRAEGFGGESALHHQGGTIAYRPRETIATADSDEEVGLGMAFAWNPSITGVKVEDTLLLAGDGRRELVTRTGAWPAAHEGAPLIWSR
jgi:Xaa-Pro aminopeptidase